MLVAVITNHVIAFLTIALTCFVADIAGIESRANHTIVAAHDKEINRT
jgi:hypothetical protein